MGSVSEVWFFLVDKECDRAKVENVCEKIRVVEKVKSRRRKNLFLILKNKKCTREIGKSLSWSLEGVLTSKKYHRHHQKSSLS